MQLSTITDNIISRKGETAKKCNASILNMPLFLADTLPGSSETFFMGKRIARKCPIHGIV